MRTILVSKYQIIINVAVSCKLLMLSTDRSEKKKKNCWLPNRRLKRFWISTDRKSRKKNKRKRKRRTFVKAKSHGLHSPKGRGSWLLFCFSTSVLSTMGKFYSTVLLETIENRVAIVLTTPKSACSIRTIPIPEPLIKVLNNHQTSSKGFLLTNSEACFIEPRTMHNGFKAALKKAK